MFTDIEDSTRYWDAHGDVKGRLMVDHHNRLLIPVIEKYNGHVVKTIGDAIMAKFSKPGNAVKAAMAMQQMLERERKHYRRNILKVRIGIHTGQAIVENKDVFGDMVNVAARVESRAKGNEILVSGSTAVKCRKKEYHLKPRGKAKLKGKEARVTLYQCDWKKSPSLIDDLHIDPLQPVLRRQKIELIIHTLASFAILFILYYRYLRYLMADSEYWANFLFAPRGLMNNLIVLSAILLLLSLLIYFFIDIRKKAPRFILRLFKGGFGFLIGFLLFYLPANYLSLSFDKNWNEPLYESDHLFVEIKENNTIVRKSPSLSAPILTTTAYGTILLLSDVYSENDLTWNKVLLRRNEYGWILRVIPARIGVPAKRLSLANKFYFRYKDLYALIAGMLGFLWGVFFLRRSLA